MSTLLPEITSRQNPWVKNTLRLHRASERNEQRRFLIEGDHLLQEAVATGWPLDAICFEPEWLAQNQSLMARIVKHRQEGRHHEVRPPKLQPVTKEILKLLSTTDSPCSVIGIAHHVPPQRTFSVFPKFQVAVEALQDPGNLGSLIRTTAAAGIGPLVLSHDSVDPTNPKVLRATAGQWFRTPPLVTDLKEFIETRKEAHVQVLAASAEGKCLWECDLTIPTLIVLGNEGAGLSPEIRRRVTGAIAIPMADGVESLNVSVSGALIIYESVRQSTR